jgi:hypothetical protein
MGRPSGRPIVRLDGSAYAEPSIGILNTEALLRKDGTMPNAERGNHNLHVALQACYDYDGQRKTVGSRLLFWAVQIAWHDYIAG